MTSVLRKLKHPFSRKRSAMDLTRCPAIVAASECLANKLLDPTVIEYEFERLWASSNGPEAPAEAACSPVNAPKNRYVNVVPFDRNRVFLSGPSGGDYINASLITGDSPLTMRPGKHHSQALTMQDSS